MQDCIKLQIQFIENVNPVYSSQLVKKMRYNKRYLFGLTHSLALDSSHICKLKINYLILPSNPYLINASVFMWNLYALEIINCKNIIVSEQLVKKRLENLIESQKIKKMVDLKWEFMRHYQIKEENLINKMLEAFSPQPLWFQPNGLCFNQEEEIFSIIIPQKGQSLILVNSCNIVLVDPSQNIERTLKFYGLPLNSVKAILLTKANNLNFFQCLLKLEKFSLIADEKTYAEVKRKIKNFFYWTENMINKRLIPKVIIQNKKKHKYISLEWMINSTQNGQTEYWEISFGQKIIRIYQQKLSHIPQELTNNFNFQYAVINDLQQSVKKQVREMPQVYRKKVILNRATHKYNHQYFLKLNESQPYVCIKGQVKQDNKKKDLFFKLKEKDINAKLSARKANSNQKLNAKQRIVYIREGYIKNQMGQIKGRGLQIKGIDFIENIKNSTIMYEAVNTHNFYNKFKEIWSQCDGQMKEENILFKVKENSFIKSLRQKAELQKGQEGESSKENMQHYEKGSQWDLVNKISVLKTLESGTNELVGKKCLYLIVKGSLKLSNNEKTANKNMGVVKFKSFYDKQLDEGEEIQVLKDSWLIEINLQFLHKQLFDDYGDKMYQLLSKPEIFS